MTMDDIKRIYSYNPMTAKHVNFASKFSQNSIKATRNSKLNSPKAFGGKNSTQVLTTASMLSLFKDMSKQVSNHLNTKHPSINECKNKSVLNPAMKNMKILKKQTKMPQGLYMSTNRSKEKCSKRDSNASKSKAKLSTRRKQKSSHRGNHKNGHSLSHFNSLDQARTIKAYLSKNSLLENIIEGSSSYENAETQYNTMGGQMETMYSTQQVDDYDRQLREQEKLLIEQEERQAQRELEVLREIEEKLEQDYNHYQRIKRPDNEDQPPELNIKKAAESTLDDL